MTSTRVQARTAELRRRLEEAEEALLAIRSGAVDALVIDEPAGPYIYTLQAADRPYRLFIEQMQQGAATLHADGTIVYCNRRLGDLLKVPLDRLIGAALHEFILADDRPRYETLRWQGQTRSVQGEARLRRTDGEVVPAYLTFNELPEDCGAAIGILITDLTEQKRHEQLIGDHELRRINEERLRLAIEATGVGIFDLDPVTRRQTFSDEAMRLWGFEPGSDPSPERLQNAVCPEERAFVRSVMEASLVPPGPGQYALEYRIVRPDGSERWVAANGRTLFSGRGSERRAVRSVGTMLDITERRRIERALRESEERFRLSLQGNNVVIAQCDLELRYVWIHNASSYFGPRATIGKRDTEIADNEGTRCLESLKRTVIATRAEATSEITFPLNDVPLTYEIREEPRFDASGSLVAVVTVGFDITRHRQNEDSIRLLKMKALNDLGEIQATYAQSPIGMGLVDRDLRFQRINEQLAAMNGIPAADHIGKTIKEVVPNLAPKVEEDFRRILKSGEPMMNVEVTGQNPANPGAEHTWLESWYPLRNAAGEIVGINLVAQDITVSRQAQAQLRNADLRKNEFLAILAHELRNSLAPISNTLHVLGMNGDRTPTMDRMLKVMERQTTHLVRLVDDLLDVSRIAHGKINLKKEPVDLAVLVTQATHAARALDEAREQRISVSLPPEPVWIEADPIRITQVLANLLNNAVKYSERGKFIRVEVEKKGGEAVARVGDQGIGIRPDMLTKVFDLFIQADHIGDRVQGGLGIGLALVQRLVELHGGRVEAHSEGLGRGSEFVIRLPLAAPPTRATAGPTPMLEFPRRVLIADDNRDAADSLAMILEALGANVRVVYDGSAALKSLVAFHPDVALLDLGMPGMDGFEIARRLREAPEGRDLTLVAVTGWGQKEDLRRTREAGFDHHLVKPVDFALLQAILSSRNDG